MLLGTPTSAQDAGQGHAGKGSPPEPLPLHGRGVDDGEDAVAKGGLPEGRPRGLGGRAVAIVLAARVCGLVGRAVGGVVGVLFVIAGRGGGRRGALAWVTQAHQAGCSAGLIKEEVTAVNSGSSTVLGPAVRQLYACPAASPHY